MAVLCGAFAAFLTNGSVAAWRLLNFIKAVATARAAEDCTARVAQCRTKFDSDSHAGHCSQASKIGKLQELLERLNLEIQTDCPYMAIIRVPLRVKITIYGYGFPRFVEDEFGQTAISAQ